jgi:hypothetical protein
LSGQAKQWLPIGGKFQSIRPFNVTASMKSDSCKVPDYFPIIDVQLNASFSSLFGFFQNSLKKSPGIRVNSVNSHSINLSALRFRHELLWWFHKWPQSVQNTMQCPVEAPKRNATKRTGYLFKYCD